MLSTWGGRHQEFDRAPALWTQGIELQYGCLTENDTMLLLHHGKWRMQQFGHHKVDNTHYRLCIKCKMSDYPFLKHPRVFFLWKPTCPPLLLMETREIVHEDICSPDLCISSRLLSCTPGVRWHDAPGVCCSSITHALYGKSSRATLWAGTGLQQIHHVGWSVTTCVKFVLFLKQYDTMCPPGDNDTLVFPLVFCSVPWSQYSD